MKRFRDLRITTKLIILFVAVAFMLTIGAGYLVIRLSTQHLISQIGERYIEKAYDNINTIDIVMYNHYNNIRSFAKGGVLTRGTGTTEEITAYLKRKKEEYGYASLSYFDMNRIRIADTEGLHLGKQHHMVRYWEDVLNGKVSAGSDVRIAEELKIPIIYFASPVRNNKGEAIGAVVARFNPKEIATIIEEIEEEGIHATLFDKDRNIIFSSCEVLKKRVLKEKIPELPSVKAALAEGDGVVLEYQSYHGEEYFTAYAHEKGYEDFKGNDWSLIISVAKDKVFMPIRQLRNAIIGVLIVVVLLVFIIGPLIAHTISKPILRLAEVTQRIGKGDLTQKAEVTAHDEIGELASSFNKMTEDLKSLMQKEKELTAAEHQKAADLENAYKKLQEMQDMLIQAEKLNAVGQLASGVAHEVRNPLAIIIQGVDYLEKTISPKEKDSYETLSMLKDSVKRADKIIGSLLDFSRATKLILQPEDINSIMEDSLGLIKHRGKSKDIEFIKETKKDIPKVSVDKNKMEQIFVNMLLNSIQAMPEGGKIVIRTYDKILEEVKNGIGRRKEDHFSLGERVVIVEIEDTGSGIPEENLKKIFDPFFTTKGPKGGSGLGLSVSRNIIIMHKGLIVVESKVGKGTKVIITLKIARG